jgi:predicted Mrr-cat superfamily restriction endonuclease
MSFAAFTRCRRRLVPIIKVQVKSQESPVSDPTVSALYGKVAAEEFGLIVTLGVHKPS